MTRARSQARQAGDQGTKFKEACAARLGRVQGWQLRGRASLNFLLASPWFWPTGNHHGVEGTMVDKMKALLLKQNQRSVGLPIPIIFQTPNDKTLNCNPLTPLKQLGISSITSPHSQKLLEASLSPAICGLMRLFIATTETHPPCSAHSVHVEELSNVFFNLSFPKNISWSPCSLSQPLSPFLIKPIFLQSLRLQVSKVSIQSFTQQWYHLELKKNCLCSTKIFLSANVFQVHIAYTGSKGADPLGKMLNLFFRPQSSDCCAL